MQRFTISESIKQEIAEAIVKESQPGYDRRYMGESYAVDTDGDQVMDAVYFRQAQAQWHPWHDNAIAFPIEQMYADEPISFDLEDGDEDEAAAAVNLALDYMPAEIYL